jgi:menaquinone-dependent protoporphyrinogen oxidase
LGSAVYAGSWRKEAVTFLEEYKTSLVKIPVWLFSSGPIGEGDPIKLMNGWHFPKALESIADRISPRDIALFHGALDIEKLNLGDKLIIKAINSPIGDFRDWDVITDWAASIVFSLRPEAVE